MSNYSVIDYYEDLCKMDKTKQLANGLCEFIDKQVDFYSQCKYEFHENDRLVEYFNGVIEGLKQVRNEVIREEALLKDE